MSLPGSLVVLLAAAAPEAAAITGTAACRERIAVPRGAVFEATLEDVSRADPVIARQRLSPAGAPPYAVRIPYDPARIQSSRRYVVRATLWAGATMKWTTGTPVPVLTRGAGATVELPLERVPAPTPPTGTFEGPLPCSDCPGARYRLALSSDLTYQLRIEHEVGPDGVVDEIGSHVLSPDGTTLVLEGGRGGRRYFAVTAADRLTLLDSKGDLIASPASLDLVRVASAAPFEPRLALEGLFTCGAGAAVLEECRTRHTVPVLEEGEYEALQRSCAEKREKPGEPVYAAVEGRIVDRASAKGPARPTVLVERLVDVRPGAACPPRFEAVAFEGTYWRLTELDGVRVPPSEKARRSEAQLVFGAEPRRVAGADGCNRMVGEYEIDETRLTFGKLAGTKMACPALGDRDQLFRQALGKARGYRLLGPELQLRDSQGGLLARFVAVPRSVAAARGK